jgi:hypothetical protein
MLSGTDRGEGLWIRKNSLILLHCYCFAERRKAHLAYLHAAVEDKGDCVAGCLHDELVVGLLKAQILGI